MAVGKKAEKLIAISECLIEIVAFNCLASFLESFARFLRFLD